MLLKFRDPLSDFDWSSLEAAYQRTARRYDPKSAHLTCLDQPPDSEQALYRFLVRRFETERDSGIEVSTYRAMLYWKLYSQPQPLSTICKPLGTEPLLTNTQSALERVSRVINAQFHGDMKVNDVLTLFDLFNGFPIHGMKDRSALAVRATFLHFCFPDVVPVYDKQVLLAVIHNLPEEFVGVLAREKDTLRQYIPFAWNLALKYRDRLPPSWPETPLRLIDMALWVHRGKTESNSSC